MWYHNPNHWRVIYFYVVPYITNDVSPLRPPAPLFPASASRQTSPPSTHIDRTVPGLRKKYTQHLGYIFGLSCDTFGVK
jgi:hypothetical protein